MMYLKYFIFSSSKYNIEMEFVYLLILKVTYNYIAFEC